MQELKLENYKKKIFPSIGRFLWIKFKLKLKEYYTKCKLRKLVLNKTEYKSDIIYYQYDFANNEVDNK